MKITYYGHASFLVETRDGTRVILDPYLSGSFGGAIRYAPIAEPADVVIASHSHDDHGAISTIPGDHLAFVQPSDETVGTLRIQGIRTAHDEAGGSKRGTNTVVILDDGDIRLVHLGDLGHTLDAATIKAIGRVDVLLVPVGGVFTIDHKEAAEVVEALGPGIVVPMHYKTGKCDFSIADVELFLETQTNVERWKTSALEITADKLPEKRTTVLLACSR